MEISFIHTQSLVHLHVNKTNFHMKGFTLGLALKQRRKATRKSPIVSPLLGFVVAAPFFIIYQCRFTLITTAWIFFLTEPRVFVSFPQGMCSEVQWLLWVPSGDWNGALHWGWPGQTSRYNFVFVCCWDDIHAIAFSDLVDLWVIKIKKANDPLRT